jgi:hypothetical protein
MSTYTRQQSGATVIGKEVVTRLEGQYTPFKIPDSKLSSPNWLKVNHN